MHRNRVSAQWLLAGTLLVAGCATGNTHWPFARAATAVPQPVSELELKLPADGAAPVVLQFWERNTLIVDLQNVASAGQVVLLRRAGNSWPARMAVRMAPQRFETLEVRGAQRLVLPVATSATGAVTADLPPGIHDQGTAAITVSWGAKGSF
ncbi:MAG: hypothetical protein ABIQ86_06105 [Steroidobacteraceae bacterium]